jgi:hypothetical protein
MNRIEQEAWCVLAYFFDQPGISPADLTENDMSFAQALVIEAIDLSYGIHFLTPNKHVYLWKEMSRIVTGVLKRTNGNWNVGAATPALLKYPELHYMVKATLSSLYRAPWTTRVKTGTPAY